MTQKLNPTSIGLFIVVGAALGVAGVILFSSVSLFTNTLDCIVYFDASLNGLQEGAPVKYRGVTIGSVKRVMVRFNEPTNDYAMPVIIQLDEKLLQERLGEPLKSFAAGFLDEQVQGGLRASLQAESLLTGVLYIDMHPNPEAPPPVYHQLTKLYPEIPSEPTQIQELMENLATMDIKAISTNLNALIVKLDDVLSDLRMEEISSSVTNTLASIKQLITSAEITNSLVSLQTTLNQYRVLGEKLNGRVDPVAESMTNLLAEANRTVVQLRGTAENLRSMLRPDAPLQHDLEVLLHQLAGSAESAATLMEFLRQHPNALITGRKAPKKP